MTRRKADLIADTINRTRISDSHIADEERAACANRALSRHTQSLADALSHAAGWGNVKKFDRARFVERAGFPDV